MNETIIGVIVGGVITAGFTFLLDYINNKRNRGNRTLEKREETYLEMLSICYLLSEKFLVDDQLTKNINRLIREKMKFFYPKVNVYSSKKISKLYDIAVKSIESEESDKNIKNLISSIKKELDVKD